MQLDLAGKIILITGGSRGIGRAIAQAAGRAGATVFASATTQAGAESITEYLDQENLNGGGFVLDAGDAVSVENAYKEIVAAKGAPDILVNNAGITRDNLLLRMGESDWDEVIKTDLKSAYLMSKICIKAMTKNRWGRIINISSVVAASGNPGQANYAAAKAAMIGFSKSLALELGGRNITVNSIAPGFIQTDMTAALNDEQRQKLIDKIPLKKLGRVQDVAAAVLYLASPAGDYITATTLHVNGGIMPT